MHNIRTSIPTYCAAQYACESVNPLQHLRTLRRACEQRAAPWPTPGAAVSVGQYSYYGGGIDGLHTTDGPPHHKSITSGLHVFLDVVLKIEGGVALRNARC